MIKLDFNKHNGKIIFITGKTECFRLKVKDITHITCEGYVSSIYLDDGSKYDTTHWLKCFEDILKDDGFFKVSRNTLISIHKKTI